MSTAALMQCPGDPFVMSYWVRNCAQVWRDDVDTVKVFVNGQSDPDIIGVLRDMCRTIDAEFSWQEGRLVHGDATRILLESCKADEVFLVEDDAFVREPGAIARALRRVHSREVDVIATPRGGMSPEVEQAARAKWHDHDLSSPNGADNGPGLWPCFFFARTADLMKTSRQFGSRTWHAGETIPGLGYDVTHDVTTDTFTTTAFELRGAGARIEPCPQYKEVWDKDLPAWCAPWFHAGGLSNGDFLSEDWDGGGARADVGGTNEGRDWAHRIWWWRRCISTAPKTLLRDTQDAYAARIEALTDFLGVREDVEEWNETLLPWINWDDRA